MTIFWPESALLAELLPEQLTALLRQPEPPASAIDEAHTRLAALLDRLLPFVPSPVVDLRLAQPEAGRIDGVYLSGSVVLADLSGFKSLSSRLAAFGRRGDEETGRLVNNIFTELLGVILAYGGGVVRFGGDQLTAFFDAARLGSEHAALACAATLAMHAHMQAFAVAATSAGTWSLGLRTAVHSGKLFLAEVGDADHIELVLTGYMVNRAAVMLESATPGQTLVSKETLLLASGVEAEAFGNDLHLLRSLGRLAPTATPSGSRWQPGPPSVASLGELLQRITLLRPYRPLDLPQHMLETGAAGGEFRPVTVLFAEFYAFSKLLALLELPALVESDYAIVGQVLNTFFTRTQAIVRHYGGTINSIDMASYGNRLQVVFGAPRAYEDSAQRAVEAALTLRESLATLSREIQGLLRAWVRAHPEQRSLLRLAGGTLRQRVGIASGVVFAGLVGTEQRCEYAIIGETVRVASGLIDLAADGDVLLTSRVQRAAAQSLESLPLPPMTLPGSSHSVPVVRVRRRRNALPPHRMLRSATPLVGRQSELEHLVARGHAALAPNASGGQVVALVGEPGMGKSRLADELSYRLELSLPATWQLCESCRSYEQAIPYALIGRLLAKLLELPADWDSNILPERVLQRVTALAPDQSRFMPLLAPLLGLPQVDSELTAALAPDQRRERLHDLVIQLLVAAAERQPLVLMIDDLHWADASSLSLLARLASEMSEKPLLLVLLYRSLGDRPEPWQAFGYTTTIVLHPLARVESMQLAQAILAGALPAAIRGLIERADGTPLFLEETVRYLVETGTLHRSADGDWVCVRPIDNLTVPLRVEQLILARLDYLDTELRELIQIIAVAEQSLEPALLAVVSGRDANLTAQLDSLVDSAILVAEGQGKQRRFGFAHALIRDVAYNSLLFAQRRDLHSRVAQAMALHYDDRDDLQVVLAQHYFQAERWELALARYLAAARQAQQRYAHAEALSLYDRAALVVQLQEERDGRCDLNAALAVYEPSGDILALTGNYDDARIRYQRLLELLQDGEQQLQRAALQRKIGNTYEHQGNYGPALDWLGGAAGLVASGTTPAAQLEQARILSDIGNIYLRQGNHELAHQYLEQALSYPNLDSDHALQSVLFNRLGGVAWLRGDLGLARSFVEQSLEVSQRSGDLVGQAKALNNLSVLAESQGLLNDSIDYSKRALEINEQVNNRREIAIVANNLGWTFYNIGQFLQARASFEQAIEQASHVRDTYHQMRALLGLGTTLAALRHYPAARHAILRSHALALGLNLPAEQLEGYIVLSEIALDQGDLATALAEYANARTLEVDAESEEFGGLQRLEGRLAWVQGRVAEAVQILEANQQLFEQLQNGPEAKRTRDLLAQVRAAFDSTTGSRQPTAESS